MTAAQASTLARNYLQAINDATPSAVEWVADRQLAEPMNHCHNCGQRIRVMINRGTGQCSEQCRKALAADDTVRAVLTPGGYWVPDSVDDDLAGELNQW